MPKQFPRNSGAPQRIDPQHNEVTTLLSLFNQGRYAEVEALARTVTRKSAKHGFAWKALGTALLQQGKNPEALAPLQRAAVLSPGDMQIQNNLGNVLKNLARFPEAEACFRRALRINPGYESAHNGLGNVLMVSGKFPEAEASFRRALEINPDYESAHHNLGSLLKDLGRCDEAEACLLRALEIKPDFAEAHSNLGALFRECGKLVEAEACLRRALEINPCLAEAHINLGTVFKELGRHPEAEASFRRALDISPGYGAAHYNLGIVLKSLGRFPEAEASFRRALEITPDDPSAHNNLGTVFKDLGRLPEAEARFRRVLEIDPGYHMAHYNLGTVLKDLGKTSEAEACFLQALSIRPDDSTAHYELGNLLKDLGRVDGAAEHFRSCLEIDPEDSLGVRLLLTSLGFEPMPMRASNAQLDKLYLERSQTWDQVQSYTGHKLVAHALRTGAEGGSRPDILDAGCGTGHVGGLIRDMANRLDGIDMSSAMLEKAHAKGIYDQIHHGDMVAFMTDNPDSYDAIASAATLIHFGDLSPVFDAAAVSLKDGGLFVFTIFPNDSDQNNDEVVVAQNYGLARGGCYAHSPGYVSRLAETAGFDVESLEKEIHEYDGPNPIMALVVALRRRPRPAPQVAS